MRKDSRGLTAVQGLLTLAVVAVIAAVGWYVYGQRQQKPAAKTSGTPAQTEPALTGAQAYQRSTTVPAGWKMYSNEQFGFEFSYPSDWKVAESADETNVMVDITPAGGSGAAQYHMQASKQLLAAAVASRQKTVNISQASGSATKLSVMAEKKLTIDGHDAIRLDLKSEDGTPPDSYATEVYIGAGNNVYWFNTGFHDQDVFNDKVLTVFESLKIK